MSDNIVAYIVLCNRDVNTSKGEHDFLNSADKPVLILKILRQMLLV